MSVLILPRRFKSQPQYRAPIDREGLGKGIQFLFNPAFGSVDLATGRVWTSNGNASVAVGQKGKQFSLDGADDYYSYTGYPELTSSVGTFFIWCPTVGSADDFGHVLLGSASPGAVAFQVNQLGQVQVFGGGLSSGSISWFNSTNRSLVFSSGGTTATCKAYLDGSDTGLTSPSGPVAWGSGNKTITLGRYPSGNSWDFSGKILVAGFSGAVWGASEAKAFHENPWLLFKAPPRRLWAVSSSITNYTLTADQFALTFAGTNANLEYNRVLPADSAALSFDVADATLKRGYALTADPVSLDFSGVNAALKYDRVLQADTASIALTGEDASLEHHRVLQAGSATIQFSVADATLTYNQPGNYVLTAEPATLGFAVADTSLKYDRKLTAGSTELAFTGADASLRYARAVIAEATQIAFTVANATLTRTGGPEPITSIVERTVTFRRSKSVTVRFN